MSNQTTEPVRKVERRNSFSMSRQLFSRIVREWVVVTLVLLPLTAALAFTHALTLDNLIYDRLLGLMRLQVDPRILIIKIDNRSLAEIGRWPWSRSTHVAMLERLASAKPAAVLFDVIFSEPGAAAALDEQLGEAVCKNSVVVLPSLRQDTARTDQPPGELLPIEPLRRCAWGVGHINVQADNDGVVRSVYLREGRQGSERLQMAWVGHSLVNGLTTRDVLPGVAGQSNAQGWHQDHAIRIPFLSQSQVFPSVPYTSVLSGDVPDSLLRDRILLIGATAPGLGGRYVTPVSNSAGLTPGIEIQANILNGLLQGRSVADIPAWISAILAVVPVGLLLAILLLSGLRFALPVTFSVMVLTLGASLLLLQFGWWWPPSASLLGVLLAYLLWNWRRSSAALAYFGWELARLDDEPQVLPERSYKPARIEGDMIQQRIVALERAVDQVRNTRRFMNDGLENLPVASLMCRNDGEILFANRRARSLVKKYTQGDALVAYLQKLEHPGVQDGAGLNRHNFRSLSDIEFRTQQGLSLRTEVASMLTASSGAAAGWLISFVDLTSEREAEEQRSNMLRFMSHDLRAPHSAILALLAMRRQRLEQGSHEVVFSNIEKQVRRALRLTDDFLQLTKAESAHYQLEPVVLNGIVLDAVDEVWSLAQDKGITLVTDLPETELIVPAEAGLLCRALFNLIENAIKYSPAGTRVLIALSTVQGLAQCAISDQGEGIAADHITQLFKSYQRFSNDPSVGGVGLGLAMVKAVVEHHGGTVACESLVGQGSTFRLKLPLIADC